MSIKTSVDLKRCNVLCQLVRTYSMQIARQACFDPQGISSVALLVSTITVILTHAYRFLRLNLYSKKVNSLFLVRIFALMHKNKSAHLDSHTSMSGRSKNFGGSKKSRSYTRLTYR